MINSRVTNKYINRYLSPMEDIKTLLSKLSANIISLMNIIIINNLKIKRTKVCSKGPAGLFNFRPEVRLI